MMNGKLANFSITIITIATVALVTSIALEVYTKEPVYMLMIKVSAGLFGVGGPLLGWSIAKRSKRGKK